MTLMQSLMKDMIFQKVALNSIYLQNFMEKYLNHCYQVYDDFTLIQGILQTQSWKELCDYPVVATLQEQQSKALNAQYVEKLRPRRVQNLDV